MKLYYLVYSVTNENDMLTPYTSYKLYVHACNSEDAQMKALKHIGKQAELEKLELILYPLIQ